MAAERLPAAYHDKFLCRNKLIMILADERYGPEDVGPYVEDTSTIDLYYGILEDYRNTEYYSEEAILSC